MKQKKRYKYVEDKDEWDSLIERKVEKICFDNIYRIIIAFLFMQKRHQQFVVD